MKYSIARFGVGTTALALFVSAGCSTATSPDATPDEATRCADIIETMSACYPDLAQEATCTPATIAQFDRMAGDRMAGDRMAGDRMAGDRMAGEVACDEVESLGKADFFAAGGCGDSQHVCGWMFCCDDYVLTAHGAFELNTPSRARRYWDVAVFRL